MLVDEVKIRAIAGDGGDGVVRFSKEMMRQGPTGGNGGKGGDIYLKGISNLGALNKFRFKKEFNAEDGKMGGSRSRDGSSGKDMVLPVPIGTVVHNLETGEKTEIVKIDQEVRVARGGRGGRGNFHFRSSTNITPKEFEYGEAGQNSELYLELKLIADIGFVGLPNVGKSSLLNELTRAKSKVANYRFTTLEPNLGVYYDLILADIPGLISGASDGKGLGFKFLRHIERTRILFHLVSAESRSPLEDYKTIREELGTYNEDLLKRREYIFISKKDEASESTVREFQKSFRAINKEAIPISIIDEKTTRRVKDILQKIIMEKRADT